MADLMVLMLFLKQFLCSPLRGELQQVLSISDSVKSNKYLLIVQPSSLF